MRYVLIRVALAFLSTSDRLHSSGIVGSYAFSIGDAVSHASNGVHLPTGKAGSRMASKPRHRKGAFARRHHVLKLKKQLVGLWRDEPPLAQNKSEEQDPDEQLGPVLEPMMWQTLAVALVMFTGINYYLLYKIPIEVELNYMLVCFLFVALACLFNLLIYISAGEEQAVIWLAGYLEETIFSLENIFVFHAVITRFAVPPRNTTKALVWTVHFQILFQSVCYLGLADFLKSLWWLPSVLGIWLIYMGISTALESHDHKDNETTPLKPQIQAIQKSNDYMSPAVLNAPMTRLFQWLLGDRFWPHYLIRHQPRMLFIDSEGRLRCTMLAPVVLALVGFDFCFEADVTVAKIEEIDNHYIAFSSSVLAAFAVPEMYFIVRVLFENYFLLKYGISFILCFFGAQLLFENYYELPPMAGCAFVVVVMGSCAAISSMLAMGPGEAVSGQPECKSHGENSLEAEGVKVVRGAITPASFM